MSNQFGEPDRAVVFTGGNALQRSSIAKIRRALPFLFVLLVACSIPLRGGVEVSQAEDRSVSVKASTYTVEIDSQGILRSLAVEGLQVLEGGFGEWSSKERVWRVLGEQPSVNVIGNLVAIRRGAERIEYTFSEDSIDVETEGYGYFLTYFPGALDAAYNNMGGGGPLGDRNSYPKSAGVILASGKTVAFSEPFHVTPTRTPRLVPSAYPMGVLTKGDLYKFTMKLGQPSSAAQQLGDIVISGVGSSYGDLASDGGGYGLINFPDGTPIVLQTSEFNQGEEPFDAVTYKLTVKDHYYEGNVVYEDSKSATLPGNQETIIDWPLPKLESGFYYAKATISKGGEELTSGTNIFTVNLRNYTHPLTRQPDFDEFWKQKLASLRAMPFQEKLVELPDESTAEYTVYDFEFIGQKGVPLTGKLKVPNAPGPHRGIIASRPNHLIQPGVVLMIPSPEMATFRIWNSKDDNNLLDCILQAVRISDYLTSRPDVGGMFLQGGSRGGPIYWITAALVPEKISAISIHVPTNFGISWLDRKYRGWGMKPADMDWEEFSIMSSYVDPVNHAENMTVDFINAYGDGDTLGPPQGVEVAFNLSPANYKRMSRDKTGHIRTAAFKKLQKEFAEYLDLEIDSDRDDAILREH